MKAFVVCTCLFALTATPSVAWQFSPFPICTLTRADDVKLTFDGTLYAIALTRAEGWPDAPVFTIRFAPNGPTISTSRHVIEGATLTVTDTGFGNVLNGLQFNTTATAVLGSMSYSIDLTGAAEPVEAFRACRVGPSA